MSLDNIRVVMINTSHPGNIGAAARVMKNMGLSRLYLVNPKQFPNYEATAMASGADDLLTKATVCSSFEEALAGCHLVLGTTARERKLQHDFIDGREAGALSIKEAQEREVALVFGRERTGLTNEEVGLCHKLINIPTNPDYQSLNVASAVQIVTYEVMMSLYAQNDSTTKENNQEVSQEESIEYASSDNMERFYQHLQETLVDIDFLRLQQSPQLMPKLRNIYNRIRIKQEELNILRGILNKTQQLKPELHIKKNKKTD
ncbi:MAG: tRNA (cytosine(32)/uridine(32)-2'-O)-methyltransferase TrmJ [gamma proteobacterium symbiont of Lucinoma myriamae]|nr:tRNA (cytosine(32)/uridine(32)-2'-O)-methyltransferase TrmJ [gamma proteobacterium symbiont of Lucinoma myriamae]MCU7819178.1 tRNA (cytosine(32)/uridine(32)-2'-O)-methyltransferase TrmJ [gamma proteobacterium symbiont of Lucinoma myriamae]MCU7831377.1 tRNA (cytosine(32)/uridine(32)-2'-O)-methyltransferase TrmJ [gamma proteobacterium symbiont of Lucinoma myriamae]